MGHVQGWQRAEDQQKCPSFRCEFWDRVLSQEGKSMVRWAPVTRIIPFVLFNTACADFDFAEGILFPSCAVCVHTCKCLKFILKFCLFSVRERNLVLIYLLLRSFPFFVVRTWLCVQIIANL